MSSLRRVSENSLISAPLNRPSIVRKDWDIWQAGISFRRPQWSLWTDKFVNSLGVTDINEKVQFTLANDLILGFLQLTAVRFSLLDI
jgi:hypothetical protein